MYKLRHYINLSMLVNIHYSLIYPHLIYAVQVWGSACKTELNKLLVLQKKAVRMMTFNDQIPQIPGPLYNSNPLFYELKILKIDDIFNYHVCKFVYSCLSYSSPYIFHDWYQINSRFHNYNTTSNTVITMNNNFVINSIVETNLLHTRYSRLVHYGGKTLKVSGPLYWNMLPENIRNSQSIFSFKNKLKSYFINQYI